MGWKRIKTTFFYFLIFLSEGGSMRSLSGKVLWFWVFLLISCPLLVWTTGWIRSKKRSGPWKDHEATAPVLILTEAWEKMRIWQQRHIIFCKKQKMQNTFLHMFTHFYTCVSGFFWVYTCVSGFFLGLHMCKWILFGLHMCKWIFFDLHILTHPYTSIHIHTHSGILWSFWFMLSYNDIIWYETKPN